jgi:hypothetical protein
MQDIQVPAMSRQTFLLLRGIGYCLLILFLLDFFALIIPFKFTDANWELITYGQVIERVPLLLLSFPLIFFGEYSARMKWEPLAAKIISWMAFVMAVFFFLGIPLVVINTVRVQNIRQAEVITKTVKQSMPVQAIADRLNKANTDNEIRNVLKSLNPQQKPNTVQIPKPQEVKKKVLTEINTSINQTQLQANEIKRRISTTLWKDSIKWAIAALVSGLFLLYVWVQSKWARVGINY